MEARRRRSGAIRRRLGIVVLVALLATAAVANVPIPAPPAGAAPSFSFTTSPAMTPAFDAAVPDYAVRCAGSSTTRVSTDGSGFVTVAGTTFSGPVAVDLPLTPGQAFTIASGGSVYHVRCLPSDFPAYSATVTGTPQLSAYTVTMGHYAVIFDAHGVPVWWYVDRNPQSPFDAKFLDAQTIAFADSDVQYQLIGLDGSPKATVGGPSVPLDFHDLQRLPNGDYLGIQYATRNCPADPSQCVDLSSWGQSAQATITDGVIVELNPSNQVVWSWSVADHIDVAAANVNWRSQFPDVIHMNSVQDDGNGLVIFSARHLDAVYAINKTTGAIVWKLGGSQTPQSLTVVGDQYPAVFSGQHYARLLSDGSLTVHDNGTRANRLPRALQFTIDTSAHTATVTRQMTDSRTKTATCCGSVDLLPSGGWLVSWGANNYMSELDAQGNPQITINYPNLFSYRVAKVAASIAALRQGMDAMVASLDGLPITKVLVPSDSETLTGTEYLDAGTPYLPGVTRVEYRATGGTLNDAVDRDRHAHSIRVARTVEYDHGRQCNLFIAERRVHVQRHQRQERRTPGRGLERPDDANIGPVEWRNADGL